MSLSSPLRGREEIAQLTARLRSEHKEYESASKSWSPEAEEKKRELRKARAETLVEIGAALECLGEFDRLQEIERLPFEQKLARLEAFLDEPKGGAVAEPLAARPEPAATQEAPRAEQKPAQLEVAADDVDGGWDDGDDEEEEPEPEPEPEPEWRGLTPEEREVRTARAAARRDRLRAKATEKAERRKARAAIAKGKQKPKQKIRRMRTEPEPRRPSQSQVEERVANESPRERETPRALSRRNDPRVIALLVAIVLVAGAVVLFLATRS
ncbi:MAG TPA: hypothetical protein VF765_37630 [Polyangiaceae bacterium]